MKHKHSAQPWIVCQIGAREHYAIPRALDRLGSLERLYTDFWVSPTSLWSKLPKLQRLADRHHNELSNDVVQGFNNQMIAQELVDRIKRPASWDGILRRNKLFQELVVRELQKIPDSPQMTVFSYSYAAKEIFRYAKSRGWQTVLGQIDPGPEEERIVGAEHKNYSHIQSCWAPAPSEYWGSWREEVQLADRIVVNSEWSKKCLEKEGVPQEKMQIVPLVYQSSKADQSAWNSSDKEGVLKVLFLGQINLRKGVARLLEAFKLLEGEPFELILAGNSELDSRAWGTLPNVHYIGAVPRSEVKKVYGDAGVFILPTLSDGYALTQLEALSCGLPVIASKHCGKAVVHGENGLILEDLAPATIAKALRQCREMDFTFSTGSSSGFSMEDLGQTLIG